ncbi:MAG TPA: hypothetical protein PKD51_11560 [Saprospiraceae bacterium]|nr:hypothetical protein [Saprospiraceae bacterium]HMU03837.1 hypothetical protein [Saprospiraceae bacterium]
MSIRPYIKDYYESQFYLTLKEIIEILRMLEHLVDVIDKFNKKEQMKFKAIMRTEDGVSEYVIDAYEINAYIKNKRLISINPIDDRLPKMENPPPPPPHRVVILPSPEPIEGYIESDSNNAVLILSMVNLILLVWLIIKINA